MPDTVAKLYIVSTPIGNLADITQRALQVLAEVKIIAAEDTRHSVRLLQHYGITTPMFALHDHNERQQWTQIQHHLDNGDDVALISDAGTPLISDPGWHVVHELRVRDYTVVPIPGPSAVIAALSVAGLPTDRFVFEGFLSNRPQARRQQMEALRDETRTIIIYESSHRILASLRDMLDCFGAERQAVVTRELTKTFETVRSDSLAALVSWMEADSNQQKGEFVVLIHGAETAPDTERAHEILKVLLSELPLKQAASLTARITGEKKNALYQYGLGLSEEK